MLPPLAASLEDAKILARNEHLDFGAMVRHCVRVQDPVRFLDTIGERLVSDELTPQEVASVLNFLVLLSSLEEERNAKCRA